MYAGAVNFYQFQNHFFKGIMFFCAFYPTAKQF